MLQCPYCVGQSFFLDYRHKIERIFRCSSCDITFSLTMISGPIKSSSKVDMKGVSRLELHKNTYQKLLRTKPKQQSKQLSQLAPPNKYILTAKTLGIRGQLLKFLGDDQFIIIVEKPKLKASEISRYAEVSSVTGGKWKKKILEIQQLMIIRQ